MGAFTELLLRKHSAIATTLFSASVIGSFYYTMQHGRSAWVDATTLMTGKEEEHQEYPSKATYTYNLKFR